MTKFTLDDFLNDDDFSENTRLTEFRPEIINELTKKPTLKKGSDIASEKIKEAELLAQKPFDAATHKSGYVAIIGKPNAGKSTLMNAMLGSRLSIVTPKAQTTRNRVIGILSDEDSQIIFLDTPGVIEPKYKLHEMMMGYVQKAGEDADIVLLMVDATDKETEMELLISKMKKFRAPVYLILNKIDKVGQEKASEIIERLQSQFKFKDCYAISALERIGVEQLKQIMKTNIRVGPPFYPKDQLSEHPERFFVTELIREQIFLLYEQEVPYSCAVDILQYQETNSMDYIDADIVVERDSQKGILIGKGGTKLKKLGTESRKEIEAFLGKRIHLKLFVKVREKWREKDGFLRGLGYGKE